jgi:integrase/recombinase XerD
LIGLLACTGLRVGEAFALDRADIDTDNRLLRIRDSKFGKSREVLIHVSTLAALNAYLERRDQLRPGGDRVCVFVASSCTRWLRARGLRIGSPRLRLRSARKTSGESRCSGTR